MSWKGFFVLDLDWEGFLCGKAELSSRDQVGCKRSLPGRDLASVIKSAASAASRNPRGAQPPPAIHLPSCRPWAPLGFLEAVLAADLITA